MVRPAAVIQQPTGDTVMAHELTTTDSLLLNKDAAWHGLGTIVQEDMTAVQAMEHVDMDWTVDSKEIFLADGTPISKFRMNVRSDTGHQMGIVSPGYRAVQNRELAEFTDALVENGDKIKIESAGSIRGGERVWFLVKGESFSIRGKDEVAQYICVSNGHDGWTAVRATPTTVRVVCSNTLHAVIPEARAQGGGINAARLRSAYFVAHHTATVMDRVEDAKAALGLYGRALDATREVLDTLAARDVNSEQFKKFFLQCYTRDVGAIVLNPATAAEERATQKAMDGYMLALKRFEEEKELAGTTAWGAFNAYTGYMQNDRKGRAVDPVVKAERRAESHLFGTVVKQAHSALVLALSI